MTEVASLLAAAISKSESIAKDVEELLTLAEQLEQAFNKPKLAYSRTGRAPAGAIAVSARRDVRALVSVARRRKQHARYTQPRRSPPGTRSPVIAARAAPPAPFRGVPFQRTSGVLFQ